MTWITRDAVRLKNKILLSRKRRSNQKKKKNKPILSEN